MRIFRSATQAALSAMISGGTFGLMAVLFLLSPRQEEPVSIEEGAGAEAIYVADVSALSMALFWRCSRCCLMRRPSRACGPFPLASSAQTSAIRCSRGPSLGLRDLSGWPMPPPRTWRPLSVVVTSAMSTA